MILLFILLLVSENKPVGSTSKEGDLLGDEAITTSSSAPPAQGVEELLQGIFGGGGSTSTGATPAKSKVDEILDIFGGSSSTTQSAPVPATNPVSLFSASPSQPLTSAAVQAPAAPRFTPYTAYDMNELQITLTPQTNPAKPGMVQILAKFQVTGQMAATGLVFQAAVPKVSTSTLDYITKLINLGYIVSTTSNAPYVQS